MSSNLCLLQTDCKIIFWQLFFTWIDADSKYISTAFNFFQFQLELVKIFIFLNLSNYFICFILNRRKRRPDKNFRKPCMYYVKSSDQIIDNKAEPILFLLLDAHNSFILSLSMATRETDKPLLLNAMLGSKEGVAMMRHFSNDWLFI